MRWCNCVGDPYSSDQDTQWCSILSADTASCVDWLGFVGSSQVPSESWIISAGCSYLDHICGMEHGDKSGQWFSASWAHYKGRKLLQERGLSEPRQRFLQEPRDVTSVQSSLQKHSLLLGFTFFSLKRCCMGAKNPRS